MSKKRGAQIKGAGVQTVQAAPTRPVLTTPTNTAKPKWYNDTRNQLAKRDTRYGPQRSR